MSSRIKPHGFSTPVIVRSRTTFTECLKIQKFYTTINQIRPLQRLASMASLPTRLIYFAELNAIDKTFYTVSVDPHLHNKNRHGSTSPYYFHRRDVFLFLKVAYVFLSDYVLISL